LNGIDLRTENEESILYIDKDLKSSISEVIIYNTISININIDLLLELDVKDLDNNLALK
jgi:hypothetical protein